MTHGYREYAVLLLIIRKPATGVGVWQTGLFDCSGGLIKGLQCRSSVKSVVISSEVKFLLANYTSRAWAAVIQGLCQQEDIGEVLVSEVWLCGWLSKLGSLWVPEPKRGPSFDNHPCGFGIASSTVYTLPEAYTLNPVPETLQLLKGPHYKILCNLRLGRSDSLGRERMATSL